MPKLMIIVLIYCLYPASIFAAKAVCTVKNMETNQRYQALKGRRSYSVAKNEAATEALTFCARIAKNANNCKILSCYQR